MYPPSWPVGGKAMAPPAKPPVTDAQQEQLNNRARVIMYGLSNEIIQARATITKPKVYDPAIHRDGTGENYQENPYVAPPIPPIVPLYSDDSTPRATSHATAATPTTSGVQPHAQPGALGTHPGLVLGGVTTGTAISPPPGTAAGVVPVTPTGGGPVAGGIIQPTPVLPIRTTDSFPGRSVPTSPTASARGAANPYGSSSVTRPIGNGAARPLPHGGVIGSLPGTNLVQPGVNPRGTQRVNPVGGVINPSSAARGAGPDSTSRRVGPGLIQSVQPTGVVGRRAHGQRDAADEPPPWDPNNPWTTAEGVPPVVAPSTPQRVDPGPAIGLD